MESYALQNTSYLEQLLRLRYEILGETFEALAASHGLVASVIRQLATREGWKQRFPAIKSPSGKIQMGMRNWYAQDSQSLMLLKTYCWPGTLLMQRVAYLKG